MISVGNLQAGGAGKTPLVAKLANEAEARSLRACILTRGYGARWEKGGGLIRPEDGAVDARDSGDEPALLHELCPKAYIAVGADRAAGFARARRAAGRDFDVAILDDGFQHWKIKKDVEIVALTSETPVSRVFRSYPSAVSRADLVVWTKGPRPPDARGRPFCRALFRLPKPEHGGAYWWVTGVADPRAALTAVSEAGYRIARHLAFRDHAIYGENEVRKILDEARAAGCALALTGKDWVKWRALGVARGEVTVLEPEVAIEGDEWERIVWGS